MAWVERRVTRTSQPQELVGIDWSNPLTAGLQGAVGVYNGTSTPVVTGSPELVATREGLAYRWLDGDNNSARVPTPAFTGSNYTLLTAFTPRAAANTNFRKVGGWVAGSGGAFFNYDHGNPAYREAIELWAGGVTGVLKYPASAVGSLTVWAATVSGTSLTGYANGVLAGSSTATGTPNGWSAVSNGQAGGDPTSPVDGILTLTWNRTLSDAEVKSLSENPWQIFEPTVEYVWVDDVIPLAPPNSKGRWIENKVQRTSQPQDLCGIDWSNPLARGLASSLLGNGLLDVASGKIFSVVNNPDSGVSPIGVGFKNTTAGSTGSYRARSNFSLDAGLAGYTTLNFFDVDSSVQSFNGYFAITNAGNNIVQHCRGFNSSQLFVEHGSSGTFPSTLNNASGLLVTRWSPSGSLHTFLNGAQTGSDTLANAPSTTTGEIRVGANRDPSGNSLPSTQYVFCLWNRALSDAEIKSLSDNPWQIFEPTTEYIWVNDFTTSGTTPVDSDRLINYLINTSSTTDLPLNYSIRTSAIQDAIFEYSLNSSLSSDRSSSYNIRTSASSDDLNQYLIRTFANSDITSSFNTRTSAANDEAVNYLIRANAAADANYSFNTRTNAFSDAGYSYLIRNATQVDFSTLYNIFGPLASDLIQSYNIRSSLNTSSTYNFNIQNSIQSDEVNQYNIRTTASNTTAADYNIRTNAGTNLESLYEIINAGQVSQALNIQYDIRALSDNSFNSYYLIYSAVGQNVDAAYNIRTNTFKDIQFSYDITAGISAVASDLTAMYNVLSTSSITQQDLINISTQVWNHSLTGDRTPGSAGSMLQDVSAREAAR